MKFKATQEWNVVSVEEIKANTSNALATGPFGSSIGPRFFESCGVPIIRGTNLSEDISVRLNHKNIAFMSVEKSRDFERSKARKGDLVFTSRGSVGQVGLIDKNCPYPEYVISNNMMKLSPDPTKVDSNYLYYLFSSQAMSEEIKNQTIGTSVPGFNLGQLRSMRIRLPPLPEQHAIARTLGSLDNKIELNRRMNETLETMARAIFNSWFVDFDPVRARAEGRELAGMDAETTALFPDSFEETELGMVPKGWRISKIGDVVKIVGGATPSTKNPQFWNGAISFATPKDLAPLTSPILLETERRITDAGLKNISSGLLPKGTVLLSSRAPIGYLAIAEIPVAVNQGFIAMICNGDLPNYYVLTWLHENMDTILGNANGTTFLEISKKNFRPIACIVPSPETLLCFIKLVDALFKKIVENLIESNTLAAMRDLLLPELLSGNLRVKEIPCREGI